MADTEKKNSLTESTLDPIAVGVAVATLPDDDGVVIAARLALEVRAGRRELRLAGLDVAAAHSEAAERQREGGTRNVVQPGVGRERLGLPGEWGVTHQVIEQRRAQPGRLATEGAA
ncbi:hypothetical protein [Pseudonocardia dioxanivorans]|uniref:hypothetical protein n=1 Tax=Pseudonocardia dioxanivorans TaxID=240495 RepID=UPI000CD1188B|nr:hypothetical protein [Pseudonocardia dioxanivorans]